MAKEKKTKNGTRKVLIAKAGRRKPPAARHGAHLTSYEDRQLGREYARYGLSTQVLTRRSRSTPEGAYALKELHKLRMRGTHGSLAQHAVEDREYAQLAKALAHAEKMQRRQLERTRKLAAEVFAVVMCMRRI